MTNVIEFKPNTCGRDFICGDIHGCFNTVEQALEELHYEPARDRLFALGDLIDYGQRSEDALEWIESRLTATVRGNHEQSMIDWLLADGRVRMHSDASNWRRATGSGWWHQRERSRNEKQRWLSTLLTLPFAATVHTATGRIGLIHAQGPNRTPPLLARLMGRATPAKTALDWDEFCEQLAESGPAGSETLNLAALDTLWQRPSVWRAEPGQTLPPGFTGVDIVLTGHSPAPTPGWTADGVLCIDTGVHVEEYGHLTVAEVHSGEPCLHRFARIDKIVPIRDE